MKRGGVVYMITNSLNTVIYIGVTLDLKKRIYEHKSNIFPDSFTKKYRIYKLVYYEGFRRIEEAIGREKQLKGGSRKTKVELIKKFNPEGKDLYDEVMGW